MGKFKWVLIALILLAFVYVIFLATQMSAVYDPLKIYQLELTKKEVHALLTEISELKPDLKITFADSIGPAKDRDYHCDVNFKDETNEYAFHFIYKSRSDQGKNVRSEIKLVSAIDYGLQLDVHDIDHEEAGRLTTIFEREIIHKLGKTNINRLDTAVYDLMRFVIADQELDKTHGLRIIPQEDCSLDKTDREFLSELIEVQSADSTYPSDSGKFELHMPTTFELTKCLTQDDVDFMLNQKIEKAAFRWDNVNLGFNLKNTNNWYEFSVPLFSKDKQKAVMMVRDLCKGLCGTGWTLLLIKEDGKWTSQKGLFWIH